jgi:photosystem II stability/assembly factor-like uncharacterized protein
MDFVMKKNNILNSLTASIFYLSILFFFIGFNFQDNGRMNGWYPQYLTSLPAVAQLQFLDSLNGYYLGSNQAIYKTTNGGDNWSLFQNLGDTLGIRKFQFLGRDTIILCAAFSILKTTNAGTNWLYYPFPQFSDMIAYDMHAFGIDSIWISGTNVFNAKIYLTTNGGLSWITKFTDTRSQFDKLYFFNRRIGFTCLTTDNGIFKTTNGGDNWFLIPETQFLDINFVDSLTGWKTYGVIKKTTNGGLNWITQYMPSGGIISSSSIIKFSNINKDTIWGSGGEAFTVFSQIRGLIYKTTNGGNIWGYQLPDTHLVRLMGYSHSDFINKNNGWVYMNTSQGGVHTITGGSDTTFYTDIENITQIAPKNFELSQNYPNPFNGETRVDYYLNEKGRVTLKIFDITGKELGTLVNEVQNAGGYGIPVTVELSSGVYFYKLVYINRKGEMQMETKKMIMVK